MKAQKLRAPRDLQVEAIGSADPKSPGVMLVGHDVDYGITKDALTVTMKRRGDDAGTQFTDALRMALGATEAISADQSGLLMIRLKWAASSFPPLPPRI